jgi:hypothetical protein
MTALPAYCPNCQSIFPFYGIKLGEGATIGIGNVATNCPVCGSKHARVSEGVYQANSTAIQVLSAPESTYAIIEALKVLAEQAAKGQISKEEAIQKAGDLSPKYAALMEAFTRLGLPGLALLVTIITVYLQYEGNKSSADDLHNILNAVTEQTLVLKEHHYEQKIQKKSTAPATHKAKQKSSLHKDPSSRRAQVNKERREKLTNRRIAFGGARGH